jgi:ABC-type glycerol-3-phosphate transport system substrate-binding protein
VDPKDFTKSTAHTAEAQQALEWLNDRYWKDQSWINLNQRPSSFAMQTSLADGLLATAEDGMHALTRVAPIPGVDFDVVPLPKGPRQRLSWITTDSWGIWSGTKHKAQAWELTKFLASPEWFKMQTRADLLIPSRVSLLDDWMQVVRSRYPSLERVNLKAVKDQLTATPPAVSTWAQFLCAADANTIINNTLLEIYSDGAQKPAVLRDRKPQIDQAAAGCGMVIK